MPPDLEYACLYWVYLQHSGRHIIDKDEVYIFLCTSFIGLRLLAGSKNLLKGFLQYSP
jgi:hypothetical protein